MCIIRPQSFFSMKVLSAKNHISQHLLFTLGLSWLPVCQQVVSLENIFT